MTDKSIWNKPIPVPENVISFVDEAVRQRKQIPPTNKPYSIGQVTSN